MKVACLRVKPSKCCFFKESVKYLGHVVSSQGVSTDPDKTEALRNWPSPKNIKDIRRYLGFTSYYRRFIKGYASIARPLTDLLKGDQCRNRKGRYSSIVWSDRCQSAFNHLNTLLCNPPILAHVDYKLPFIVHTDASLDGLGAILYQVQNGSERVISYASRGLRSSERNYPAHKLEFLALRWAVCEKFHDYLYGQTFEVHTDNNPLTYVLLTAKLDATGHRWLADLAS